MARKTKPTEAAPEAIEPPPLNETQERFAQEYAVDLNATQAAIRAGYDPATAGQTGHQLLKKPQIDAAIRAEMAALAERTHVNQDFVMRGLLANYHRAMQIEPVIDRNGPTGEYKYDGNVANCSLELMGKHINMFREKLDANLSLNGAPSADIANVLGASLELIGIPEQFRTVLLATLTQALKVQP